MRAVDIRFGDRPGFQPPPAAQPGAGAGFLLVTLLVSLLLAGIVIGGAIIVGALT